MAIDDVERRVLRVFGSQWAEATAILHEYGSEPHEREAERVRRAILTLADGDLGRLRHFTEQARQDYRDVLMWAEYPEAAKDVSEEDVKAALRWAGESEC